jgi:uncharacterized membrane protein YfhO
VPNPAPRANFFGPQSVRFLPEDTIPNALRSHVYTPELILMPERSRTAVAPRESSTGSVVYHRPSSDEIVLDVSATGSGFANVLESYDPGWSADVDGRPAPVFAANGFTLAAPVSAGSHSVRFVYRTPGRSLGIAFSLVAAGLLAGLLWMPVRASAAPATKPAEQGGRPKRRRRAS